MSSVDPSANELEASGAACPPSPQPSINSIDPSTPQLQDWPAALFQVASGDRTFGFASARAPSGLDWTPTLISGFRRPDWTPSLELPSSVFSSMSPDASLCRTAACTLKASPPADESAESSAADPPLLYVQKGRARCARVLELHERPRKRPASDPQWTLGKQACRAPREPCAGVEDEEASASAGEGEDPDALVPTGEAELEPAWSAPDEFVPPQDEADDLEDDVDEDAPVLCPPPRAPRHARSSSAAASGASASHCKCKNSRCLKLYCECFAAQRGCGDHCKCQGCKNDDENDAERSNAIDLILSRNPTAFEPKVVSSRGEGPRHCVGCKCSKTGCKKRYCDCYRAGVECSDACKCKGCRNVSGAAPPRTAPRAAPKAAKAAPRSAPAPAPAAPAAPDAPAAPAAQAEEGAFSPGPPLPATAQTCARRPARVVALRTMDGRGSAVVRLLEEEGMGEFLARASEALGEEVAELWADDYAQVRSCEELADGAFVYAIRPGDRDQDRGEGVGRARGVDADGAA